MATSIPAGPLVGSAEQSFVFLMQRELLPPVPCVAASPCFRNDGADKLHQPYFFKVELVVPGSQWPWLHLVEDALSFFRSLPGGESACMVLTTEGADIELHGIEIGSYGERRVGNLHWVYGTGYADPRFGMAAQEAST